MHFDRPIAPDPGKQKIRAAYRMGERRALLPPINAADLSPADSERVFGWARAARARMLLATSGHGGLYNRKNRSLYN